MIQKVLDDDGQEGWRWGDDGTSYFGPYAKRMALREGAANDPVAFANLQGKYGVVVAGEEVEWQVPEGAEILHLD